MEVWSDTGLHVAPQRYADKYCDRVQESGHLSSGQPSPPQVQLDRKSSPSKAYWALAVFTVLCMAVALGAGLGAGLALHRKPNSSTQV